LDIVQQNLKNNFSNPALLCTRDYEIEWRGILRNKYISNDIKKSLLLRRLVTDYTSFGPRPNANVFKWLPVKNREEAIKNFTTLNTTVVAWSLFIINGIPYVALDVASYQELLREINKMTVTKIELKTANDFSISDGRGMLFGVVIIRDDN